MSKLGNPQGTLWTGRFIFPLERAEQVAHQMQYIADDSSQPTSGMVLVMAPPPDRKPCIVVSGRYIGDPSAADAAYKRLYDLGPIVSGGSSVPVQNMNDAHKATEMKGGYTRYGVVGLQEFKCAGFVKVVELWRKLVQECPDAASTSFNFQLGLEALGEAI